jgi:hypothetical protein
MTNRSFVLKKRWASNNLMLKRGDVCSPDQSLFLIFILSIRALDLKRSYHSAVAINPHSGIGCSRSSAVASELKH